MRKLTIGKNVLKVLMIFIFFILLMILPQTKTRANLPLENGKNLHVKNSSWVIRIRRVIDPVYPMISDEDYRKALTEASRLAKKKLGVKIQFKDVGTQNITDFFKPLLQDDKKYKYSCFYGLWDYNLDEHRKAIGYFFDHWHLDVVKLKKYFPKTEQELLFTEKDVVEKLVQRYEEGIEFFKKEKMRGIPIIKPEGCYCNSFNCWLHVREYIKGTDFILTNAPIFMDTPGGFLPYFRGGIMQGFGWFTSTFPVYGDVYEDISFLEKVRGKISSGMRPLILGEKIIKDLQQVIALGKFNYFDDNSAGCLTYLGPKFKINYVDIYKSVAGTKACSYEVTAAHNKVELYNARNLMQEKKFLQAERDLTAIYNKNKKDDQVLLLLLVCKVKLKRENEVDSILKKFAKDESYKEYETISAQFETGLDYIGFYDQVKDELSPKEKARIKETLIKLRAGK